MHSLLKYSGAKSRMVFPKRCRVRDWERRHKSSNRVAAAGESRVAKSPSDDGPRRSTESTRSASDDRA